MQHVAIMKPKLQFLEKIMTGQKTIESRWLRQRRTPWQQIYPGDTIFFKNSGQPISARATVNKVTYIESLTPSRIQKLLQAYGKAIGIEDIESFYNLNHDKRYCVLVWLEEVHAIRPFAINKQGFGAMSAWISVEDIAVLRIKH